MTFWLRRSRTKPAKGGADRLPLREQLDRADPRLDGDTAARMRGEIDEAEYASRVATTRNGSGRRA
jgi:hypothetical protein